MKSLSLVLAGVLAVATVVPATAQTTSTRRHVVGRPGPDQPGGGSPGYQANTYVRRPSARTPTDVGNMQFPDPSDTPAGRLPSVPVGR